MDTSGGRELQPGTQAPTGAGGIGFVTPARLVSVVIADRRPIVRDGLRRLLAPIHGLSVAGVARTGAEAVSLATTLRPDLLILDLALANRPALQVLKALSRSRSSALSVVLASDPPSSEALAALRAGARGFLAKDDTPETLLACLRTVLEGRYWIGRREVADRAAALREIKTKVVERTPFGLTPRERQVVTCVVAGLTNRAVSRQLSVAENTVKHHLRSALSKTGASNRLELTVFAIHHRLVASTGSHQATG